MINAFVGGMIGLERSVLPQLAEKDFGISSKTAVFSFIIAFKLLPLMRLNKDLKFKSTTAPADLHA